MHTFQLTTTSPTHRRLSDSTLGILRELPAGTATTRPVNPADFEVLASSARETARAELRAQWAAQPSWIRGPFDGHFRGAQVFLDAGDDDAAADLIRYTEAPGAYTTEQLATFVTLKTTIAAAIAALP